MAFAPMAKAATGVSGEMIVYGPIGSEKKDIQEELATREGIIAGLGFFERLGGHVDFGHMYSQTVKMGRPNPDLIVGRGFVFYVNGRPWLKTVLRPENPLAQAIWRMVKDGLHIGYSIEGGALRIGNKLVSTIIRLITIAESPMGEDQWLQLKPPSGVSLKPGGSLVPVFKALGPDVLPQFTVAGSALPAVLDRAAMEAAIGVVSGESGYLAGWQPAQFDTVLKAFVTGAGIVDAGAAGGSALRPQFLLGHDEDDPDEEGLDEKDIPLKKALSAALAARGCANAHAIAAQVVQGGYLR